MQKNQYKNSTFNGKVLICHGRKKSVFSLFRNQTPHQFNKMLLILCRGIGFNF